MADSSASAGLPLFALGAHSDDLAFSLGAAFCDGRLAGCHPVTVFSRSAWTSANPAGDEGQVTALRKAEDERFFAGTGAAAPLWLDQPDAPLRGVGGRETVFTAPITEPELEGVRRALRALLPARARLLVPLALGGHLDHRLVRDAACTLDGHAISFYEDLPYAAFMELEFVERHVAVLAQRRGIRLTPLIWQSRQLAAGKARVVASYPSQVDGPMLDHLLRHAGRVGGGERVWTPRGDESGMAE